MKPPVVQDYRSALFFQGLRAALLNIILVSIIEHLFFKCPLSQFSECFTINTSAMYRSAHTPDL